MADAKINVKRLKHPEVNETLIKGAKFIRWDDVSRLRVDLKA